MGMGEFRELASVIGVAVALAGLLKAVHEYSRQGVQKRAERFIGLSRRFKDNEAFTRICAAIECGSGVGEISVHRRREYAGFFEEVALMANSGLIDEDVAHYMFGHYILACFRNGEFWVDLDKEDKYWSLFVCFAQRLERVDKDFKFRPETLRF